MTSAKQRRLAAFEAADRSHSGRHNDWDRMTPFARYDPDSGRLIASGTMAVAALERMAADNGWSYLRQSAQLDMHYVDVSGPAPRRRVRSICPARLDGHVLSGQPAASRVTVTDPARDVTVIEHNGEALAFDFDLPGAYVIRVESVPHTDGVYTIEVQP